jgi:hypothetical protein
MYIDVNNFLIPIIMTKKMGRPPLPKGLSKDVQIGVRFNPDDDKAISKAIEDSRADQTKAQWLRDAALIIAHEWVQCREWTAKDLHGKYVEFLIASRAEGPIKGVGKFYVWERGDGLLKIIINSLDKKQTRPFLKSRIQIIVPQEAVQLIKRQSPGSKVDFSLFDPALQKCIVLK